VRDSYKVPLIKADGSRIEGELFEGISETNLDHFERLWRPKLEDLLRETIKRRAQGEECYDGIDARWPWRKLVERANGDLSLKHFAIEAEGETQGLMLLSLVYRSRIEPGQHIVYVDRLAAAPWNRKSKIVAQRLRPVGLLLIRHAIGTSLSEGFCGRVGLHSLPGAVSFYRDRIAMKSFGPEPAHEDLEYFELSAAQAQKEIAHN
jgi:hypothetical protein